MDKKNIAYWIATVLTVVALGGSGVMQLLKPPELVANMERLGYPLYVMSLMGVFKIAGVITIAVPKLPRLKEWAYAGIFINMVGGAYSHVASKDPHRRGGAGHGHLDLRPDVVDVAPRKSAPRRPRALVRRHQDESIPSQPQTTRFS